MQSVPLSVFSLEFMFLVKPACCYSSQVMIWHNFRTKKESKMPPSDYKHHAEVIGFLPFAWVRLRAAWSRIRNRGADSVEGRRVVGLK